MGQVINNRGGNEMREKEVKVDSKHRIKSYVNPYSIIVGITLIIFSIIMLYVVFWGLMNTFKNPFAYDRDPAGFPILDELYHGNSLMYNDASGKLIKVRGLFMNYQTVLNCMKYEYTPSYYLGWNLDELVRKNYMDFPGQGQGAIVWLWCLWNSAWTCFAGTVLPMLMCAIVGYACAKYKYKFSDFVYGLVVFMMVLPVVGLQPVTISLLQRIRFFDNPIGYLIWNCNFSSMYFMIFFSFYQGLSDSYFEAAEIDGASQFRVLTTIAIPLAKTMFAATFVVHFIATWTDYGTIMVYLPSYPTIAYGIHYNTVVVSNGNMARTTVKLAALFLMAIPAFTFFTVFRKQLMGNISIGGIKE